MEKSVISVGRFVVLATISTNFRTSPFSDLNLSRDGGLYVTYANTYKIISHITYSWYSNLSIDIYYIHLLHP